MKKNLIVAENIKKLRIERGFSQVNLAEFLKVDQSLISKIEKGERNLSADMIERLSFLFGVSIDVIENEEVPNTSLSYAFRGNTLTVDDMDVVCAINRIALNSKYMDELLEVKN